MRRFFAIASIVGAASLTIGACGSDDNGGGGTGTGGTEGGIGGSGGTGGASNNCGAYCAKLTTAGCAPANCATDCSGKATCVPAWNNLVQCVATTGTVTCTAGQPQVAGCDSQGTAYADCVSGSGGTGGGGTGGTGGNPTAGSCQGNCDLPENTPVPDSDPPCYCDDACTGFGDCCDDKEQYCPSGPPPPSDVCKKYCCSASDCAPGETCPALSATIGTLGVCTAPSSDGGAPDSGPDPDAATSDATVPDSAAPDGTVPDAGPPPDSGGALPAGCVTGAAPPCNPLTNAGCDSAAGEACDLGGSGLQCFPAPNDVPPGGDCDNGAGPYCIAGYHCSPP